jgi:SAM-dependent methyltransferase
MMSRRHATRSRSSSYERAGWWSSVELPGGYVAPRIDRPISTLEALRPPDLTGKTVLHVGAGDDYFAFAAERLGAARVVALNAPSSRRPEDRDGFAYARGALASDVQDVAMEISSISPENIGEFDVVLFLDTLHRLCDPLPALERVARVTRERLIVETLTDVPFPNRATVLAMLRELDFDHTFAIPTKRVTSERLRGLPAQLRTGIDVLAMTPSAARPTLRRDLAKSLITQSRLVAHGVRDRRR